MYLPPGGVSLRRKVRFIDNNTEMELKNER